MDDPTSSPTPGEMLARRLAATTEGISRIEEQLRAQEHELRLIWEEGPLSLDLPSSLPDFTGSEHEVWCDGERVVKATLPGGYGRLWGARRFANPVEYLARIQLVNEVFALGWQVCGLCREMGRIRIVSTQPFLKGTKPSLAQIARYMTAGGFTSKRHRFGDYWLHDGLKLIAFDAEPANFVATPFGLIPVDIILQRVE